MVDSLVCGCSDYFSSWQWTKQPLKSMQIWWWKIISSELLKWTKIRFQINYQINLNPRNIITNISPHIFMRDSPQMHLSLPFIWSATYNDKVWLYFPQTYDLLPTFVSIAFLAYCAVRQTSHFGACSFNDGKNFVSEWMDDEWSK